jgi:DNA polymerase alpha subunit A
MSKRSGVKSALAQLREGLGGKKRTEQYEVREAAAIIEEVEEGEYERVRRERASNDFVVDDEGHGYADDGGEVWDDEELYSDQEFDEDADAANLPGGRARKLRAQAMRDKMRNKRGGAIPAFRDKGQKSLSSFMKPGQANASGGATGVNPVKSANVCHNLDDLMKEFEENLDDDNETTEIPQQVARTKRVLSSAQSSHRPMGVPVSKKPRAVDMEMDEVGEQLPENSDAHDDHPSGGIEETSPTRDQEQESKPADLMSNILGSANWSTAPEVDEASTVDLIPGVIGETKTEEPKMSSEKNDGAFDFYLIDVHEDVNTSSVLLFGRMRSSNSTTQSCCIVVKNIHRNVFFLHNDPLESDDTVAKSNSMEIFKEFDELRRSGRKPFADIKEFKLSKQLVRRNYAFELKGVPHGLLNFLKLSYSARYPALPAELTGRTFSKIFGANTSLTELLLVKCKIQGPSWMRVQGAVRQERRARSWCKEEFTLDFGGLKTKTFKPIVPIVDNAPEPPRLSILGLSVKSVVGGGGNGNKTGSSLTSNREIVSVAMCFAPSVKLEAQETEIRFDANNGRFAAVRMQEGKALPRREIDQLQSLGIQVMEEKPLLSLLCSKIQQLDPDVIIGHNVFGNELDVLANRLHYFGLKVWHRISRCQRNEEPNPPRMKGASNSQWAGRQFTLGRLVCDTYLNARELMRESTYELSHLTRKVLGVERQVHPIPSTMVQGGDAADPDSVIRMCTGSAEGLRALADHTLCDTLLAVRLAWRLQVLPLTRQLSNLAGNLWSNSLLNKRAERNEWLLVHEFKRLKYIVPDKSLGGKPVGKSAAVFDEPDFEADGGDEDNHNSGGGTFRRKKAAAYMGGLVLEPKAGLYDKLVLLLDFNSLYPSIIREYNICFTTVERLDAEESEKAESAEAVIPAHPPRGMEDGVLPRVIARLVNSRRAVKQMLKTEKTESGKMMLDIRQKALKLTANSMYGCLGFSSSRFYAKPIASLITWTGRQTLQATVDLVEKNLRLDVVYGDTDSIFVHTGQDDFAAALQVGAEISKEVNKRYSKLEIEMDGVFRSLLLLKKKKYAGLKVRDWDKQLFDLELKGIDMVRRDWCVMSKSMGGAILDQLLTPTAKSREDCLMWLEEYLRHIGKQMDSNAIPLSEYVITKGITKMPDEYPDAKSQPHVLVAKRRIEAGERIRPGNEIPYIVCKISDGDGLSLAERARSPEEAARLGLTPDIAWYKAQQIHPPIARLCTPTGLADSARLAEWLGLDPSRFGGHDQDADSRENQDEAFLAENEPNLDVDIKYKDFISKFKTQWNCPNCKLQLSLHVAIKNPNCMKCSEQKIETAHICNLVCLAIRELQNQALLGWAQCENGDQCGAITRQVSVFGNGFHCPKTDCVGGRLKPLNINSKELHQNLLFVHELCLKYRPEAADVVQEAIDENAYDTVDLCALFTAFASIKGA